MSETKDTMLDDLEMMIDRSSLLHVMTGLVTICFEKADHVDSNWQDAELARTWRQDARQLEKVLGKLNN